MLQTVPNQAWHDVEALVKTDPRLMMLDDWALAWIIQHVIPHVFDPDPDGEPYSIAGPRCPNCGSASRQDLRKLGAERLVDLEPMTHRRWDAADGRARRNLVGDVVDRIWLGHAIGPIEARTGIAIDSAAVWGRIRSLEGETFTRAEGWPGPSGGQFTYECVGEAVRFTSGRNRWLPRRHLDEALELVPLRQPSAVFHLECSVVYDLLHDERVRGNDW